MSKSKRSVASGTVWTLAAAVSSAVLQLSQTMLAARYLEVGDFGALALANIMVGIALAFQDMGLSSYCIHVGEVPRSTHSTLYWISVALGLAVGTTIALLGTPLAAIYQSPVMVDLLPLVGVNLVVLGASTQYQANLVRTFKAALLAKCEIAARSLTFGLVVWLLATRTLGVHAIIVGLVAYSCLKLLLMVLVSERSWHPQFAFDRNIAPKALRYGSYQAGSQLLNQARTQADQLILGWALGPEPLGIYSLAKELIAFPLRFLQLLFARITLPGFARVQGDAPQLRRAVLQSLQRTGLLSASVYAAMAIFAPWIVDVMYGARFDQAVPLLVALSIFGALRPIGANAGFLAQAIGKTGIEFRWNVISAAIALPVMVSVGALKPDPWSFAVATSTTQILITCLAYPLFFRELIEIGFLRYVNAWAVGLLLAVTVSSVSLRWRIPRLEQFVYNLTEISELCAEAAVELGHKAAQKIR